MQCKHVFEGHAGRIFSVALCVLPDGKRIAASASHDRSVRIWSVDDCCHLRTIEYTDFVWRVFIVHAPKPLVVAFVSTEEKIQVSDLETGETVNIFYGRLVFAGLIPGFPQPVIIKGGDDDLSFLDVNTGLPLFTIMGGFEKVIRAVSAFHPLPTLVFTTWNAQNRRSTIQTYDLRDIHPSSMTSSNVLEHDQERIRVMFEGDSRDGVTSLVITLGAKPMICSGHFDFLVRLWCIESKQLIMTLDGHSDYVGSVTAWRGNQPIIISGSSDGTIKAWNTQTGALIATGEGHTRDIWAVAVSHGNKPLIVSSSFDRTMRVWDLNPMLAEINWERRKWFVLFLAGLWRYNALPMIHIDAQGEVTTMESSNVDGYVSSRSSSSSSSSSSSAPSAAAIALLSLLPTTEEEEEEEEVIVESIQQQQQQQGLIVTDKNIAGIKVFQTQALARLMMEYL